MQVLMFYCFIAFLFSCYFFCFCSFVFFSGDSSCRFVFLVFFFAKINFLCSTRGHNAISSWFMLVLPTERFHRFSKRQKSNDFTVLSCFFLYIIFSEQKKQHINWRSIHGIPFRVKLEILFLSPRYVW